MDYWLKQTKETPLYPDLDWEKPEQKAQRGRLLIVGGNLQSFAAPAHAFAVARGEDVGEARVIMPDALKKTISKIMPEVVYAPSTLSGSFSLKSADAILQHIQWAEGVLLAGDLGRNSETAVVLECVVRSTRIPMTITRDALDYFTSNPSILTQRPDTLIVGSFAQIQKLATSLRYPTPLRFDMTLTHLVEALHNLTATYAFSCITKVNEVLLVSHKGTVITMLDTDEQDIWRLNTATCAMTHWLQHPTKTLESFVTSLM